MRRGARLRGVEHALEACTCAKVHARRGCDASIVSWDDVSTRCLPERGEICQSDPEGLQQTLCFMQVMCFQPVQLTTVR